MIPTHIRELIAQNKAQTSKLYNGEKKEVDIKLQNINKWDFSSLDLKGIYFYNCIITESIFRKCNLEDCKFIECTLVNNNFSRANMNNVEFIRCKIEYNDFRNTNGTFKTSLSYVENNYKGLK